MKLSEIRPFYKKSKDIDIIPVLEYLSDFQGEWSFLAEDTEEFTAKGANPIRGMPVGTKRLTALFVMRCIYKLGFVGGCGCGCRGDFEITDKGLAYIGRKRTKRYSGY